MIEQILPHWPNKPTAVGYRGRSSSSVVMVDWALTINYLSIYLHVRGSRRDVFVQGSQGPGRVRQGRV